MKQIQETFAMLSIYIIAIGFVAATAIAHYQIEQNAEAITVMESDADTMRSDTRDVRELLRVIERDIVWIRRKIGEHFKTPETE